MYIFKKFPLILNFRKIYTPKILRVYYSPGRCWPTCRQDERVSSVKSTQTASRNVLTVDAIVEDINDSDTRQTLPRPWLLLNRPIDSPSGSALCEYVECDRYGMVLGALLVVGRLGKSLLIQFGDEIVQRRGTKISRALVASLLVLSNQKVFNAQYTSPTPFNCRVESRRRCVLNSRLVHDGCGRRVENWTCWEFISRVGCIIGNWVTTADGWERTHRPTQLNSTQQPNPSAVVVN